MSYIDKFLGVAGMGSTIANVSLLKRFLSGVTVVIALTAISSTMAGMIMIVGFYALYLSLVHYGLEPQAAAIAISGLALAVTAVLAALAVFRWRQLRRTPYFMQETPIVDQIGRLADAFLDGLLSEHNRHNR